MSADDQVPPNPPEHPAESARYDGPQTSLQSIVDVHIDALADQFTGRGKKPLAVAILVRFEEPIDEANNDVLAGYGFRDECDTPEKQGEVVVSMLTRTLRAARRVFMGELR